MDKLNIQSNIQSKLKLNKLLSLALITSLSSSLYPSLNAGQSGQYSDEDISKILDRVKKLESELDKYKASTSEQIEELHARSDENEFQSSLNRIKWGGSLEATAGTYDGVMGSMKGMSNGRDFHSENKWSTKLNLEMLANINERTKFNGRISVLKNWADSDTYANLGDSSEGKRDGGSAIYLERAYIDYMITKDFIATIGRQPSSDGPGMSLKENTPRKSTYPSLLFNGNADGLVFTYAIPEAKGAINDFKMRAAYGKGFQWDDNAYGFASNNNGVNDLDVYGAFLEGSLPFTQMGQNLVVLSYVYGKNFVGHEQQMYDIDNPMGSNVNLGDFEHYGLYFENNKAFGSDLNYFASFGWSKPDSNTMTNTIMTPQGAMAMSLLQDDGHAYHLGARYDLTKDFMAGYEFNHGSQYWFSYTSGSTDVLNKLSTRGDVHDLYLIYQMDMNQFLRVGYMDLNYDYTGSGWHVGVPMESEDRTKYWYLVYNVRF